MNAIADPSAGVRAPGPPGLPWIGHVRPFLRDKLGFLSRSAAAHGDVVRLEIGARTYLLLHPDDISHVLLANSDNYVKTGRIAGRRGRRFFGASVVTSAGPAHVDRKSTRLNSSHRL